MHKASTSGRSIYLIMQSPVPMQMVIGPLVVCDFCGIPWCGINTCGCQASTGQVLWGKTTTGRYCERRSAAPDSCLTEVRHKESCIVTSCLLRSPVAYAWLPTHYASPSLSDACFLLENSGLGEYICSLHLMLRKETKIRKKESNSGRCILLEFLLIFILHVSAPDLIYVSW